MASARTIMRVRVAEVLLRSLSTRTFIALTWALISPEVMDDEAARGRSGGGGGRAVNIVNEGVIGIGGGAAGKGNDEIINKEKRSDFLRS